MQIIAVLIARMNQPIDIINGFGLNYFALLFQDR